MGLVLEPRAELRLWMFQEDPALGRGDNRGWKSTWAANRILMTPVKEN